MQEGLPGFEVSGIYMADQLPLVDASDLARKKGGPAQIVVDASRAHQNRRDQSALVVDQSLRPYLRFPVGELRIERPVLVDRLAVLAGRVHQQRDRKSTRLNSSH